MSQARQFMLRVNTYGPDLLADDGTMPDYRAWWRGDHLQVRRELRPERPGRRGDRRAGAYGRRAEVFGAGVSVIDSDSATALVAGSFTSSYPDPDDETRVDDVPLPFRVQIELVKVDGEWLVDSFVPVTGPEGEADRDPEPRSRARRPGVAASPSRRLAVSAPSPSWYDLLDVDRRDADEIRAAWKSAIAELDPTDRRFRCSTRPPRCCWTQAARTTSWTSRSRTCRTSPAEIGTATHEQTAPTPPSTDGVPAWLLAGLGDPGVVASSLGLQRLAGPEERRLGRLERDGGRHARPTPATPRPRPSRPRSRSCPTTTATSRTTRTPRSPYMTDDFKKRLRAALRGDPGERPGDQDDRDHRAGRLGIGRSATTGSRCSCSSTRPTLNAELTEPEIYKNQATRDHGEGRRRVARRRPDHHACPGGLTPVPLLPRRSGDPLDLNGRPPS